ncbi:saccharopine dehydrogenase NADP-binding domain-containing protein [Lysobacter sp. CFH 32150]|uniref:saccharopine dehydrogenase family protein n=1 Tax=Lysobacter sp. CFH 32150 TaxID=2927128 RepID=UPI001FA70BA3|nr:saccharopine dehydrogenase NADP-binding domain-containing protein [Lysobacter sp. CFH 32150]MCI4569153.1 saccharopine dehydrogenase NADP-binding domain-containing protein [Lysobacter sp. CFH 32150]
MQWMIYGANGYTGRLIAKEARQRGLQPILAGRNAETVQALATELGLPWRVFTLDRSEDMHAGLRGVGLVLHCAGPFSATAAPMLEACLEAKTHYLDITGEVDVFAHCHAQDERAKQAGIVVLPGAGFDVVPTDCLAAMLKRRLPQAESLVLAFDAGGGFSPGTAKSSVEGLGKGGRVRKDGVLQRVPLAWKSRTFERDGQTRTAMTIPWGDVYTAFVSTGIPDIEVYTTVPPSSIARIRRLRMLGPLLGWAPVQAFLKRRVEKNVRGPSETTRAATQTYLWGEARGGGREEKLQLRTPNGYALTVTAALGIVEHLLQHTAAPGYYTPSLLMGPEYVLSLPGVSMDPAP